MGWPIRIKPSKKWPQGAWQAVYRDAAGKQRSAGIWPHNAKRAAQKAADDAEAKIRGGTWLDPKGPKTLFRLWAETWKQLRNVRDTTADVTERRLKHHLLPEFGDTPLGQITRAQIQAWVNRMAADGIPRDGITTYRALLSTILNAAVDEELIGRNPCRRITIPENVNPGRAPLALTATQAGWILAALPERERPMALTGLGAGLRIGELAGLLENEIDLGDTATLDVVLPLKEIAGRREKGKPKTAAGERGIPLPPTLREILKQHTKDTPRHPEGYVFTSPKGMTLSRTHHRTDVWKPAVELSGQWPDPADWVDPYNGKPMVPCTMHDLRSTYASLLENGNIPRTAVQELMGHKGAGVTERYLLASPETLQRAMEVIDRFLLEVLKIAADAEPEIARRREQAAAQRKAALRARREARRVGKPVAPLRGRKRKVVEPKP